MTFVPIMWTVWSAFIFVTAVLYIYRSRLTRDEEDQIFLDDSFQQEKLAQEAIVAKVAKIEPVMKVMKWLVVAMTLVVVGYYVRDILVHLNVIG